VSDEQNASPARNFSLLFGGLILLAVILLILANSVASTVGPTEREMKLKKAEVKVRLQPIGKVNTNPNAKVAVASSSSKSKSGGAPETGKQVYHAVCSTCHGSGMLGSPKFGSQTQWTPHAQKGLKTLFDHAIHGFKKMPARGGSTTLSDKEVENGVVYMLKQAKVYTLAKKSE